jgi:ATP-dependent Zn protease
MISLGGYLAEKLIFGSEHISTGASHDIQHATVQANAAVREFGMVDDPLRISVKGIESNYHFFYEERYGRQAKELMRNCLEQAEQILKRNKRFLLEMGSYLTEHSRMNADQIEAMAIEFSAESWVKETGFIAKDEYFQFKQQIQQAIEKLKTNPGN